MSRTTCYVLVFLLSLTASASAQKHVRDSYTHDIAVTALTSPASSQRMPLNVSTSVTFEISNQGTSDESNIGVYASIVSAQGSTVYSDTATISSLAAGNTATVHFRDFTPQLRGRYAFTAISHIPSDENTSNDTLVGYKASVYELDASAVSVTVPAPDEVVRRGTRFRPTGVFSGVNGDGDIFDVPVKVLIRRCSDGILVFQSDSTIDVLRADSTTVTFPFPASEGFYHTWYLPPGCYTIAVIARYPTDGDRSNDTAYSNFTIDNSPFNNDLSVDSLISPSSPVRVQPNAILPISARVSNKGSNSQASVTVIAQVIDRKGLVVYRDSVTQSNWAAGATRIASFRAFSPVAYGTYTLKIFSKPAADDYSLNDTLLSSIYVGYHDDVELLAVLSPASDTTLTTTLDLPVTIKMGWIASENSSSVPVYIKIMRLEDSTTAYTEMPVVNGLSLDNPTKTVTITRLPHLPEGHYRLGVFGALYDDGNPANDTLWSTFTVRLGADITIDTIDSPIFGSVFVQAPIMISAEATNHGINEIQTAEIDALVRSSIGVVAYRDTLRPTTWAPEETRHLQFKSFNPSYSDYYTLEVTAINDSDFSSRNSVSSSVFLYQPLRGVREASSPAITLSFDPRSNGLRYQATGAGTMEAHLLDMLGREVWSVNLPFAEGTHTIDLGSAVTSGTYAAQVRIRSANGDVISRTVLLQIARR